MAEKSDEELDNDEIKNYEDKEESKIITDDNNPPSNQYCYINESYKDRKKGIDNSEFYKLEYQTINNRLNQVRNNQITLMTASISSTAVVWGFTYYFTHSYKDIFSSIFFLIPLFFLIPSLLMFFDKAISHSKLIGYLRNLEQINTGFINLRYYRGYINYDKCFHCNYLNSCHINLFKDYKKGDQNNTQNEDEKNTKKITKESILRPFILFKKDIFRYYNPVILSREFRFLSIGFVSYLAIIIIGFIFAIYTGYKNGLFVENYEIFLIILFFSCLFTYILNLIIGGIYKNSDQIYWRSCLKKINILLPVFLIIIWIIFLVKILHISPFEALSKFMVIAGLAVVLMVLAFLAIMFILIPIVMLKRYFKAKNEEKIDSKLTNFKRYSFLKILKLDSTHFCMNTFVLLFYIIFSDYMLVENSFIFLMLLIAYALIVIILYCHNIFISLVIRRDNPNNYEILWYSAMKKTDKFYETFDTMDDFKAKMKKFKEENQ